ncbi:hypothetical protein FRC14_006356 [Serendipita sp. 396]|nr:hypothetical protein FRC14_006356 [Serendipita sp. 396]KAG8779411.1 hypothetical protein FRC15_010208 [Serendipita sp. 397]KAG8797322.1 hypothetical protein FRC16_009016 [Serendipita sp. 398]KAG8866077.1 hypothetical protein FRC20_009100 [Serendipita sp. 405]
MAEAIGLGLSIVGLVKLSATVLQSCYDYVAKAKQAPEDVQRVISEVSSLQTILEQLQRPTSDPSDERMSLLKSFEAQSGPFKACHDVLAEVQKKLQSLGDVSSIRKRLLFPFQGAKLDELLQTLEKHKTSFLLALAGDQAKVTLNIEKSVNNVSDQLEDMKASEYRKEVLRWFKGADPTTNHNAARKKHEPGTGEWLLDSEEFRVWMQEARKIMWLNGIPGAGKTVLSFTVIDYLISECKNNAEGRIAYYYFDFGDHGKQTASGCLRSLTHQLCEQSKELPEVVKDLYTECKSGTPSLPQLTTTLIDIFNDEFKHFIVIDALDECMEEEGEHQRELFFEALQEITSSTTGRYSIFIASRPEVDISRNLTDLGAINFSIQQNLVDVDIRSHVRACLEKEARFKKWPAPVKTQIEDRLASGANGMFRWAVCQLDSLKRCLKPANAIRELETLPKTLDDTYARILKRISSVYEREMKAVLILLAFSNRPMTIQEVAEATAVNVEDRLFSTEERFSDPYDMLELCSSLVSLSDPTSKSVMSRERVNMVNWGPDIKVIQFAHSSVKEYILSERAQIAIPAPLRINAPMSHQYITELSLIYLLDFNDGKPTIIFDHETYPLLTYAALYWMEHLSSMRESDQANIEDLLLRLFDPDDPSNLMNCLNLYDPTSSFRFRAYGTRSIGFTRHRNKQDFETPLYYASYYGLLPIVDALLGKSVERTRSKEELGTALEAAASGGYVAIAKRLLDEGADPNAPCRRFYRPLQAAASSGSLETVKLLLEGGADVHARGGEWGSALHLAAKQGNAEVVQLLVDNGHDVNPWVEVYGTALATAAQYGNDNAALTLLKNGADRNFRSGTGLLVMACRYLRVDSVRAFLDAGAAIKLESGRETALHAAAKRGELPIIQLLIERGADINAPGGAYGTPLTAVIQSGNQAAFQFMLDNGADIHDRGTESNCPIDQAIWCGNLQAADQLLELGGRFGDEALEAALQSHLKEYLVKILLDKGADPNAPHKTKGNMLQYAIIRSEEQAVRWLLEAGADVNAVEGEYGTALQAAATHDKEPIVRLLLQYGANVNTSCGRYGNALQAAAMKRSLPVVQLLLDHGADINVRGGMYETALQAGAMVGEEEVVKLLLNSGADVNIFGGKYRTALQAAATKGYENIVKLLLAAGADINVAAISEHATTDSNPNIKVKSTIEVAALSGNIEVVRLLLEHALDINADSESCAAALSNAARLSTTAMLDFLIAKNVDVRSYGSRAIYSATDMQRVNNLKLLLAHSADVNLPGGRLGSALQVSINYNRWDIMSLLLESGADVNFQGGEYGTALQQAIESGSKPMAMELLRRGAKVNVTAGKWGSALAIASCKGDEEMFHELLRRGADINLTYGHYGNPLQAAIRGNYYNLANELLDRGAEPTIGTKYKTALIAAAGYGKTGQLELIKRLISLGVDIEAVDEPQSEDSRSTLDMTALQHAAYTGNESVAHLLLEAGANVNTHAGTYGHALQIASMEGKHAMVLLLLKKGANVNAVGGKYGTALQAAADNAHNAVMESLLQRGADVNVEGGRYGSPLQAACRRGHLHSVQLLLERGAKVNRSIGYYGTALHAAAKQGSLEIVKILLEQGADVNLLGGKHGSALQAACCYHIGGIEGVQVIELLLERGANVHQEGGKWGTALQAAAYHHQSYVEILLHHGADPNLGGGRFSSPLEAARRKGFSRVAKLLIQHGAIEKN